MNFSEKLNGYWEEGYHFYFEISNMLITIRDYARRIMSETTIEYDAEAVERGEKTPIKLGTNVLSTNYLKEPMSWLEDIYFENGEIHMTECYSFMDRRDEYVMKKVVEGPFDHIIIRDDEFLEKLQGKWVRWSPGGYDDSLFIDGNTIGWGIHGGGEFHVISYKYRGREMNKEVYIVPADLTRDDFGGFCRVEVLHDQLHTTEIVYDMSMPLSVFAREDMIDKIEIPSGAKRPAVSVMLPPTEKFYPGPADPNNLFDTLIKGFPQPDIAPLPKTNETKKETAGNAGPGYCPQCAAKLNDTQKFCHECGARVRE